MTHNINEAINVFERDEEGRRRLIVRSGLINIDDWLGKFVRLHPAATNVTSIDRSEQGYDISLKKECPEAASKRLAQDIVKEFQRVRVR